MSTPPSTPAPPSRRGRAARFFAFAVLAFLAVAAAVAAAVWWPRPRFVVAEQRTGVVFFSHRASDVDTIELAWVHSIEKTPWREVYRIEGDELELTDVYLKSYGAGAPADIGGVTTLENGTIHISGVGTTIPELSWVHSHDTQHTLTITLKSTPEPVVFADGIPQRSFVRAGVERPSAAPE